ncbi:MAG: penicillin-binding protein 2 [Persicimonas sp.]
MPNPSNIPKRSRGGGIEDYRSRYMWLIIGCLLVFMVILARLWFLQIVRGDDYYRASSENIIRDINLPAPRGRILDHRGDILAENRPSFDVFVVPHIFNKHDTDETLGLLKRYLHLSDRQLDRVRAGSKANRSEVLVRRDATRAQVASIESDKLRLPGVEVRPNSHRHYPLNQISAHTVGFLSEASEREVDQLAPYGYRAGDYIGRMGIEQEFEELLHGSPGIDRQVVDAHGIPQGEAQTRFLIGDYTKVEPVPGRDLRTTLDADLMQTIDRAMRDYPSGAVVALDPRDGSVRAMYSKPSINPNSWTGRLSSIEKMRTDNDPFKPMIDKSVNAYFPGSIYKTVASAAALEEGMMSRDSEVHCPGSYKFGGRRFRCWKWGGHGHVDVREALQGSCDVYYYKVAEELGIDTLAEYGYKLGFGQKTGMSINNESAGRVPTKEWHRKNSPEGFQYGFALNTVLGQGDTLVTPLQAAVSYGALANGGKLYYPRLVDEVVNAEGQPLFKFPAKVRRRLDISDETLGLIRQGLHDVVNKDGGTGYKSRLDEIEYAGKTGTAQVHAIGSVRVANRDKEFKLRDHAWFASYAPADDPEIVVVVFLEHAGHGGSEAAPVAKKVLQRYFDKKAEVSMNLPMGPARPDRDGSQ